MSENLSKLLYKLDLFQFILLIGTVFLLGGAIGYSIWGVDDNNIYQRLWEKIVNVDSQTASDFLSTSAEIIGALVGISIPISLSIVSDNLKTYKDVWISEMFRNEYPYKYQFRIVIPTIFYVLVLTYLQISHPLFLWVGFLLMLVSIFLFYQFLRLMEKYSTQSEEVVLTKAKKQIDEILE